jgi:alpha-tubulin suppressor-like RCC1 family protein
MKLIDLTRINQLIDSLLDKINDKYATKAELNSGLKGKAEANHGTHLTLGNTQNSAYRGDYGNAAYQHSQAAHAPSNAQKNSDITKAEIEAKLTGTISSHTHSDIYSPTSHNHTSLTGLTSLTFSANSDDSSIIKITKDSATSYTDFVMSDDAGSDMWRWRFKAWDSSISGMTAEYNLMTLKATSTTKGQLSVNGNVTADSFTEGGTALSSKYAAASHGTHLTIGTGANNAAAGNHTHNYAGSSSAGGAANSANVLNQNTSLTYGWSGLNYFNINGTAGNAAKVNDTPTTAWWHIIRCNHANSTGFYTDIAVPFNATSMYYKRITNGAVQNNGWVKMLDALNWSEYAAAKSHTHTHLEVKSSNAITSTTNDTTANWGAQKTSIHWYTTAGQLTDQPSQWGYLLNVGQSSEVHQLWMTQASGDMLHRGGNATGWSGTWKTLLDTSNFKTHVTPSAIGAATSSSIGTLSSLKTSAKGDLVSAINELFQNANNGKQLIANAIGDSGLTSNSTFNAMSNAITDKRDRLYNLMAEGGYEVNSSMSIGSLLDLLESIGIGVTDIKQIVCGEYHTFILKKDGSLYSCGNNTNGQLGIGSNNSNAATLTKVTKNVNNDVKQIACGSNYSFILKNNGSLWSCGGGDEGELGLGNTTSKTTFTQVTTNINNDVKQIASGYGHTFILKNDGSLWCCGLNVSGQLGLGDTNSRNTFTKVTKNVNNDVKQVICGYYHTFIIKNDGSLWSCGSGTYGQLGLGSTGDKYTFTKVTTNVNNDIKQIACGVYHTLIIKNDGSLWACGTNGNGQLGLGDTNTNSRNTFTQVTTNVKSNVKQVVCGSYYTFIIQNDGSLWSCGSGMYGQLGLGSASTYKYIFNQVTKNVSIDAKQIACGYEHTFLLKNDGTVWSCGFNGNGQLGLGTSGTNSYSSFTNIPRGF